MHSRGVDSHQRIQVVEFQECSAYARQDATVMCLDMDIATHYVFSDMWKGSKLSTGNYCMWLCSETVCFNVVDVRCKEGTKKLF